MKIYSKLFIVLSLTLFAPLALAQYPIIGTMSISNYTNCYCDCTTNTCRIDNKKAATLFYIDMNTHAVKTIGGVGATNKKVPLYGIDGYTYVQLNTNMTSLTASGPNIRNGNSSDVILFKDPHYTSDFLELVASGSGRSCPSSLAENVCLR